MIATGFLIPGLLALLAAALSWLFLWLLIPLLSRRLLDQPNARSSHQRPTPRGGGVAFVMVGSIAVAWLGSWLPLLCLPLALVGFLAVKEVLDSYGLLSPTTNLERLADAFMHAFIMKSDQGLQLTSLVKSRVTSEFDINKGDLKKRAFD